MSDFRIPINDRQQQFLWFASYYGRTTPAERTMIKRILKNRYYTESDKTILTIIRNFFKDWFDGGKIFKYGYPYFYEVLSTNGKIVVYQKFYYNSKGEKKIYATVEEETLKFNRI